MLSKKEILQIYKHYLGNYFVKPDKFLYNTFQKALKDNNFDVVYYYGNRHELLQCGLAYLDLNKTYMQHTQIYSYELINNFLHLTDNQYSQVFYEYPNYPLIIYHPTSTTDNQRLVSLITHVYSYRQLKGQKTLILSEKNILSQIMDKVTPILDLSKVNKETEELYDD